MTGPARTPPRASRAERRRLARVYARIPDVGCVGACYRHCGPITMSRIEADRMARAAGRESVGRVNLTTLACPMLTDGRCDVYPVRPTICRLFGAAAGMECPHGCTPDGGLLSREEAHRLLAEAEGGGDLVTTDAGGLWDALSRSP